MKIDTLGITRAYVTLNVPIDEMKDWDADRIKRFFEGAAQTVAAVNPNNWDTPQTENSDGDGQG